jgi:hypothetical protein
MRIFATSSSTSRLPCTYNLIPLSRHHDSHSTFWTFISSRRIAACRWDQCHESVRVDLGHNFDGIVLCTDLPGNSFVRSSTQPNMEDRRQHICWCCRTSEKRTVGSDRSLRFTVLVVYPVRHCLPWSPPRVGKSWCSPGPEIRFRPQGTHQLLLWRISNLDSGILQTTYFTSWCSLSRSCPWAFYIFTWPEIASTSSPFGLQSVFAFSGLLFPCFYYLWIVLEKFDVQI